MTILPRGNLFNIGNFTSSAAFQHQAVKKPAPKTVKKKPPMQKGPVMEHDALAHDLAKSLELTGRKTWENIAMNGAGSARPDVFAIFKTLNYNKCRPTVYECKVSRADFLSDINSGKWKVYRAYAQQIWFAVPYGMVNPTEVPDECGLTVRTNTGWQVLKRPKLNPDWELTPAQFLKLILGKWGD